jgi:uncharacterized membrane protein YcaP (DUF421 family)
MSALWDTLFGPHADSHTITALQMTTRAVLVFFVALVLLRASGKRTFGGNTAFDMVIKILLGAVLSRAVAAASPFWGTLLAGLALVSLHRLLAWAAFHSAWVGRLVNGEAHQLTDNGQLRAEVLCQHNLTPEDVLADLRKNGNLDALDQAKTVCLERDGSISVVKKQP